jgi:hypothetical protein
MEIDMASFLMINRSDSFQFAPSVSPFILMFKKNLKRN